MSTNLTLNAEMIQFKQPQVSSYGHCWSKHGISVDPKKIEALNHMEFPPDKETMRFFLGMVNYPNWYSALSTHLSALTHQAINNKTSKEHFETKAGSFQYGGYPYFDVNAETTLQMDASKKGLGACILQKGKMVCYASRA